MRLAGQRVLVTGGSTGIGLALAARFLQAGCEVLVCGRDPDKLDRAAATVPGLRTLVGDLSRLEDVRRIAAAAGDLAGGVSILVNNAAVQLERGLFTESTGVSVAATADEIGTNLTGLIQLTSLCLPVLRAAPAAAVVNVTTGLVLAPKASAPVLLRDEGRRPFVHHHAAVPGPCPCSSPTRLRGDAAGGRHADDCRSYSLQGHAASRRCGDCRRARTRPRPHHHRQGPASADRPPHSPLARAESHARHVTLWADHDTLWADHDDTTTAGVPSLTLGC